MVNIKTGFIILIILFAGVAAYAATGDYYDFAAEEISASPSSPAVNQESIITIKIKNAGTNKLFTSAGTNTYNYQFDNFLMTEVNFTSPSYDNIISSSGYLYYTIKGKFLSSGEKNLVFTIDTGKELTESNEDNNSVTKKITVVAAGGVDLSVDSITLDSEEPLVNNSVTLTVSLKNSGTVSLTSSVGLAEEDILMNFSGFTIDSQSRSNYPATANPLNPGSAFKYTYKGKFFKTGTNSLFFQLDRNNRLAETNENNNSLTATKSVYLTEEEADTFELTDITVSSVSSTSVAVSWKTSKGTTGKVNYKEKIYEILESEA
ncbi:hypothetical protein HY798_04380, partial [Candidatus Falkowbacteria bacterium]|nr:hypothetical protein [Candidatus Falkowbacteria bacterium]